MTSLKARRNTLPLSRILALSNIVSQRGEISAIFTNIWKSANSYRATRNNISF